MGTFVGIWYPPRTSGVSALDRASVSSIASRLVGVPVTYNHAGTVSAFVASGGNSAITFSDFGESPLMAVVGGITAACVLPDGTGLCRGHILGSYPSVAAVVASGGVGLSLTHVMSSLAPVEMTLTASPARAGSVIVDTGLSALKYYMRALATPDNTAIMDTTPESAAATTTPAPDAAPSAVETVLSSLSAADRAIVEERLSAMASSAIAANTARAAAETRLADSAIGADHQNSMIRDQLANLSALFTPAEVQRYNLGGDAIAPQVESSSPDVLKALMGRTIMACSNEMLRLNSELDSQRAPKRARSEAAPPTASAAAAAPATPSAALRAALGHQFEPAGYTL